VRGAISLVDPCADSLAASSGMTILSKRVGSLILVGTGIEAIGQTTLAAKRAIEGADEVLYLVPDPLTQRWIESLNPACESLQGVYEAGKDRALIYGAMAARILREVRKGRRVCAVMYGHPGIFVHAGHEAIRTARAEGHRARMLAAVSAEDCLFADLGLDPGDWGCQSYEATNFLMRRRRIDTSTPLILWQVGSIGVFHHGNGHAQASAGLTVLADVLGELYGEDHQVTLYEASLLGICDPRIELVTVQALPRVETSSASTLYVPPRAHAQWDDDLIVRLGIDMEQGRDVESRARTLSQDSPARPEQGQDPSGDPR
jgi:uncharacterized protein YabN with tetrapyrrole methylase and pyrophosphatase domain